MNVLACCPPSCSLTFVQRLASCKVCLNHQRLRAPLAIHETSKHARQSLFYVPHCTVHAVPPHRAGTAHKLAPELHPTPCQPVATHPWQRRQGSPSKLERAALRCRLPCSLHSPHISPHRQPQQPDGCLAHTVPGHRPKRVPSPRHRQSCKSTGEEFLTHNPSDTGAAKQQGTRPSADRQPKC